MTASPRWRSCGTSPSNSSRTSIELGPHLAAKHHLHRRLRHHALDDLQLDQRSPRARQRAHAPRQGQCRSQGERVAHPAANPARLIPAGVRAPAHVASPSYPRRLRAPTGTAGTCGTPPGPWRERLRHRSPARPSSSLVIWRLGRDHGPAVLLREMLGHLRAFECPGELGNSRIAREPRWGHENACVGVACPRLDRQGIP